MSDSVVKLRIDSKEYDANIKRAGQALSDYMQKVREGGGTMKYLDEGVMEAVQALGQLGTKADNTRAGLREMTQTIADLTVQYRALNDEDKGSEFGREMARSLQELTERAGAMRDAMADTSAAINNAASDTRCFDQLAQGASLVTAGFQGLQGAAKMLGIEMDDNVEVIAKLQAAMAVTNSLTTIQTALQKQSALMQGVMAVQAKALAAANTLNAQGLGLATAAQAAFNAVAKANPYVLLATAVGAVVGALAAFCSGSSEARKEAEAMAKSANRLAQKVTGAAADAEARFRLLQVQWKSLKTEAEQIKFIKDNSSAFWELGRAVNSVNDANDILIKKAPAVIKALRAMAEAEAYKDLYKEDFRAFAVSRKLVQNNLEANRKTWKAGDEAPFPGNARRSVLGANDTKVVDQRAVVLTATGARKLNKYEKDKEDATLRALDWAARVNLNEWMSAYTDALSRAESARAEAGLTSGGGSSNGRGSGNGRGSTPYEPQTQPLTGWNRVSGMIINSEFMSYDDMMRVRDAKLSYAANRRGVKGEIGSLGVDVQPLQFNTPEWIEKGWESPEQYKKMKDNPFVHYNEYGEKEVSLKEVSDGIISGLGDITSNLETLGIKVPEGFKKTLGVLQSISGILSAINTIVMAIQAISAVDTIIPFHRGGVVRAATGTTVPGNYGFDAVPALLTSGETVLTRAQAGNIASQLQQGSRSTGTPQARVSGEDIYIALTNYMQRRGYGEVVMSH